MASGIAEVKAALDTMPDGDFERVKAAVEKARFDRRAPSVNQTQDYRPGSGTFETVVTPYAVGRRITRAQWKELMAIWKSHPPAGEEE